MYVPVMPKCEVLYDEEGWPKTPHRTNKRISPSARALHDAVFAAAEERYARLTNARSRAAVANIGRRCVLVVGDHSRPGSALTTKPFRADRYVPQVADYVSAQIGDRVSIINGSDAICVAEALRSRDVTSVIFTGHSSAETVTLSASGKGSRDAGLAWWGGNSIGIREYSTLRSGYVLNLGCGSSPRLDPRLGTPFANNLVADPRRALGFLSDVPSDTSMLAQPEVYLGHLDLAAMHHTPPDFVPGRGQRASIS